MVCKQSNIHRHIRTYVVLVEWRMNWSCTLYVRYKTCYTNVWKRERGGGGVSYVGTAEQSKY